MVFRMCLGLALCFCVCSIASADGLIQSVPDKGEWVKYRMANHLFGTSARESERVGELRISCVGTVIERDIECRWIEIRTESRHLDGKLAFQSLSKFLIPVEKLRGGHVGQEDIIRAWTRRASSTPELIKAPLMNGLRFAMYFPGETSEVDTAGGLNKREFVVNGESIQSQETCRQQVSFDSKERHILEFDLWKNEATQFGVVGAKIETRRYSGDRLLSTFTRNYEVIESGSSAISELPDCT